MKRLLALFLLLSSGLAQAYSPAGTIVLGDGTKIKCESITWRSAEYERGSPNQFEYRGTYQGSPVTIDQKEIKSISFIEIGGVEKSSGVWSKEGKTIAAISLKDGRSFTIQNSGRVHLIVRAEHKNPITKKMQKSEFYLTKEAKDAKGSPVTQIIFGSDSAVKINPRTGKVFPMNFHFDPETGEELQIK